VSLPVVMGYAAPARQGPMNASAYHVVVTEPLPAGRLHREPGDALCRRASRFSCLDTSYGEVRRQEGKAFNCKRCLEIAERLGIDLTQGGAGRH
jgi:hypothetical protein